MIVYDKLWETMKNTVEEADSTISNYYVGLEWKTPEPKPLMTTKAYKEKLVEPFVKKLKDVIATFVSNFLDLSREYRRIKDQLGRARKDNEKLERQNRALQQDSEYLKIIKHELGSDEVDEILDTAYQKIAEHDGDEAQKWGISL